MLTAALITAAQALTEDTSVSQLDRLQFQSISSQGQEISTSYVRLGSGGTPTTMILWGRQDQILGVKDADRFQHLLPQSKLVWIENCGHVPHLEQPQVTADLIRLTYSST